MGKFIKIFDTHSQYEAYTADTANFITPNVSFCLDVANAVHYSEYVDPYSGHEYVDLGLPSGTKWAKVNIGASSETERGNLYMYGKGTTQYNSSDSTYNGTENPLAASADTAVQEWGGIWHMPTYNQIRELTANTTFEFVTVNDVKCGKFTAENGNYILFPAVGYWYNNNNWHNGTMGHYWGSSPDSYHSAVCLVFFDNGNTSAPADTRNNGSPIRAVADR